MAGARNIGWRGGEDCKKAMALHKRVRLLRQIGRPACATVKQPVPGGTCHEPPAGWKGYPVSGQAPQIPIFRRSDERSLAQIPSIFAAFRTWLYRDGTADP
jgi:hypothetical protein